MTGPQRRLLDRALLQAQAGKPLHVRGVDLRVASALARAGYVTLRIGGAGRPFSGDWWWEIVPTDAGRLAAS